MGGQPTKALGLEVHPQASLVVTTDSPSWVSESPPNTPVLVSALLLLMGLVTSAN